jgi:hypothetical protein
MVGRVVEMKRELKGILIVILLTSPVVFSGMRFIPEVKANQGGAKVYILQLGDVGQWWVDSKQSVADGAAAACTPQGRSDRMPRAHPVQGENPPFYNVTYDVITTWSAYVNVILNEVGVIIVNTHGEILPIPTGYPKEQWVDVIANKMCFRRMTWVNMAGYPFYWVWYQGDTAMSLWGSDGFKNLTGHIGLSNVEIPTSLPWNYAALTGSAAQDFGVTPGWDMENVSNVQLVRPLRMTDFANCTVLPLYKCSIDSETYWEGAVIAFAKCGYRVAGNDNGSGYFVHLGTNQTYDASTPPVHIGDRDYWRGYVATAAAVWAETLSYEPKTAYTSNNNPYNPMDTALGVAPCITGYYVTTNPGGLEHLKIRLVFGLYGAIHALTGQEGHRIDTVRFNAYELSASCSASAQLQISKQGEHTGITLQGPWIDDGGAGLIVSTVTFIAPLLLPPTAPFMTLVGGVMLFSDWLAAIGGGPTTPGNEVDFTYSPQTTKTVTGSDKVEEFQSLIVLDLDVPMTLRQEWRLITFDFDIHLTTVSSYDLWIQSGLSIAAWFEPGNYVTAFIEDFETGMAGCSASDHDGTAGYDYWGRSNYFRSYGAWCAQVGTNSLNGETPNIGITPEPLYDDGMNATLEHPVDLRSFKSANITFQGENWIESGDYLAVEYYVGNQRTEIVRYDEEYGEYFWDTYGLSPNATKICFRFVSNNDHQVLWGAFVDNIEIKGLLPNDAFSGNDAGGSQGGAVYVGISNTLANWAGYINAYDDISDFYNFTISSANISEGKYIYVHVNPPPGAEFGVALYDSHGNKKAQAVYDTVSYGLCSGDAPGQWSVEIFYKRGYGQYNFDLQLQNPTSGGGCPTLFVWNGTQYNDFGVINIHNPTGEDVVKEVPLSTDSVGISGYKAYFRLREGWEGLKYSHSVIDQVKLYAVISGNRYPCPLIYAKDSKLGNVLLQLLFSDDSRVNEYLLETIDLRFIVPYQHIEKFVFVIEGCNIEKIDY